MKSTTPVCFLLCSVYSAHALLPSLEALKSLKSLKFDTSFLDPTVRNVVHLEAAHSPAGLSGIWKTKVLWKSRWVQEQKTIIKPVWKKIWGPVTIHEWVPIPQPPPEWSPAPPAPAPPPDSTPLEPVKPSWTPAPEWKPADSQFLLNSYQTIDVPTTPSPVEEGYDYYAPEATTESDLGAHETSYIFPRQREPDPPPPTKPTPPWRPLPPSLQFPPYSIDSSDPEPLPTLSAFLIPPKPESTLIEPSKLIGEFHITENSTLLDPVTSPSPLKLTLDLPYRKDKEVSPYAATLAQAVLLDRQNKAQNITERPPGLTEVVYKPDNTSSTTSKPVSTSPPPPKSYLSTKGSTESSKVFIVTPSQTG